MLTDSQAPELRTHMEVFHFTYTLLEFSQGYAARTPFTNKGKQYAAVGRGIFARHILQFLVEILKAEAEFQRFGIFAKEHDGLSVVIGRLGLEIS